MIVTAPRTGRTRPHGALDVRTVTRARHDVNGRIPLAGRAFSPRRGMGSRRRGCAPASTVRAPGIGAVRDAAEARGAGTGPSTHGRRGSHRHRGGRDRPAARHLRRDPLDLAGARRAGGGAARRPARHPRPRSRRVPRDGPSAPRASGGNIADADARGRGRHDGGGGPPRRAGPAGRRDAPAAILVPAVIARIGVRRAGGRAGPHRDADARVVALGDAPPYLGDDGRP